MEISKYSNKNNNKNHCRNYFSFDIKEKIQILHKINANEFQRHSFEKKNIIKKEKNTNMSNNNNLFSSTLSSFYLNYNNVYQKKLVKNNSKRSPNISIYKISKSQSKDDTNNKNDKTDKNEEIKITEKEIELIKDKEKIINEMKTDSKLKQYIKNELKKEIIDEFLEEIAEIDEEKVNNFLRLKKVILYSDKFKNEVMPRLLTKETSISDYLNSNMTLSYKDIFQSEKNNITDKKEKKVIFNMDEIEMKDVHRNRIINAVSYTPGKNIYNNQFINNNEKYIIKNPFQEHDNSYCKKYKNLYIKNNNEIKQSNFNFQIINKMKKSLKRNESFCDYKSNISIYDNSLGKEKKNIVFDDKIDDNNNNNNNCDREISNNKDLNKKIESNKIINFNYINNINTINNRYLNGSEEILPINKDKKDINIFDEDRDEDKHFMIKKKLLKSNYNKLINENNSVRENDKKIKNNQYNEEFKEIKDNKELNLKNFVFDNEKKKILINKIFGDSKKVIIEKKKKIVGNKNISNIFRIKRKKQNKESARKEILNKTYNYRNNKVIKSNQNNHKTFNSFSVHRERSKTFSELINERNSSKSNIFRISHIKNYLKVLQKKENKEILLNTKWLKNISKKNIPLLCFGKK